MSAGSRFLAAVLVGIVWIFAAITVASGPKAPMAITPTVLGATVKCVITTGD